MKKYLVIQNEGLIEKEAFTLLGASTKRGDSSKIGYFGSGLKYAIAYLIRNEVDIRIFTGKKEVELTTKKKNFRDKEFNVICIDGMETSMTTEMGIDWETWHSVREVICNAYDEENGRYALCETYDLHENTTTFVIEITESIKEITDNWDLYFSEKRKDIVLSDGKNNDMYKGGEKTIIYRKGIRCHKGKQKTLYHYDINEVAINESREIKDMWDFKYHLSNVIKRIIDVDFLKTFLRRICDKELFEYHLHWSYAIDNYSDAWLDAINDRVLVPHNTSGFYESEINNMTNYIILPDMMVRGLNDHFKDKVNVIGDTKGVDFKKVEQTPKIEYLLREVGEFFKEAGYDVKYPIEVCEFNKSYIDGHANNNTIYLSNKLFDMGRRKIAEVIIEESEHLKTNYEDETREFQTHFINLYLTEMEDRHGYFL